MGTEREGDKQRVLSLHVDVMDGMILGTDG